MEFVKKNIIWILLAAIALFLFWKSQQTDDTTVTDTTDIPEDTDTGYRVGSGSGYVPSSSVPVGVGTQAQVPVGLQPQIIIKLPVTTKPTISAATKAALGLASAVPVVSPTTGNVNVGVPSAAKLPIGVAVVAQGSKSTQPKASTTQLLKL